MLLSISASSLAIPPPTDWPTPSRQQAVEYHYSAAQSPSSLLLWRKPLSHLSALQAVITTLGPSPWDDIKINWLVILVSFHGVACNVCV